MSSATQRSIPLACETSDGITVQPRFDGQWMRVYLDGNQVGSLQRPGKIQAGTAAPGCIGSSNGGETFQGAMDDLRIYAGALTARQVAVLHRQGWEIFERSAGQLAEQIKGVYQRGPSFAPDPRGVPPPSGWNNGWPRTPTSPWGYRCG